MDDKKEEVVIVILFFIIFISIAYNLSSITGQVHKKPLPSHYETIDGINYSVGSKCIINTTTCSDIIRWTNRLPEDINYVIDKVSRVSGGVACGDVKIMPVEQKNCMKFNLFNGTAAEEKNLLKKPEIPKEIVKQKIIPRCVDTDDGKNPDVYGEVLLKSESSIDVEERSGEVFRDNCVDKYTVEENYCRLDTSVIIHKRCSSEKVCKEGACVSAEFANAQPAENIKDYEDDFENAEEIPAKKTRKTILNNGLIILI